MKNEEVLPNGQTIKKIKLKDGTVVSYFNGKFHSYDGPAIQPPKDSKLRPQYFIYGKEYSKKDYDKALKDRTGVPFYKTSLGKSSGARA